ncbi:Heme chaperone CcmE [Leminorella richardii]|uniref:Cytochrome c-type biogenesis protein CcmE n=1 Tax=Leminorella richardii TaxID=158841 RepID=A0A2X4UI51_9GAMM|nr:cytochrome c maturation protein CcmE [Leminorella richardii]SQI38411.1 Heme chaperone CcmE [Leminorella richardii]
MNPRRKNRMFLAIAILIGMAVTISLVLYALRSNIDLFYTPGEIVYGKGESKTKPEAGQRLRIGGMVMPGSVVRDPDSLKVSFKVYDARAAIDVRYEGILPDLFREDQSVVAQGVYGEDNVVNAKEVLAKHDENYMPPEVEEAMKGNHQRPPESYQKEAEAMGNRK